MLNFIFSFSPGFHLARFIKIIKFCSIFLFLFFLEPNLQGLAVILQLAPAIYGLVQLFNSPHKYGAHAYEFKYDFISGFMSIVTLFIMAFLRGVIFFCLQ